MQRTKSVLWAVVLCAIVSVVVYDRTFGRDTHFCPQCVFRPMIFDGTAPIYDPADQTRRLRDVYICPTCRACILEDHHTNEQTDAVQSHGVATAQRTTVHSPASAVQAVGVKSVQAQSPKTVQEPPIIE